MRLLLRFPFLVLQIVAGLLTAYGTFAMISTAGIQPPNAVVLLGLIAALGSGLATARVTGNPFAGWWPSLATPVRRQGITSPSTPLGTARLSGGTATPPTGFRSRIQKRGP